MSKKFYLVTGVCLGLLVAAAWTVQMRTKDLAIAPLGTTPVPQVPGTPSDLPVLYDRMPEFDGISAWLNSEPLTPASLKGKVVLIDFWTYSCINCIRTLPYVTAWHEKYKNDGFTVVGVHTPEFAFEKVRKNVEEAIKRHGITYPVPQDNDFGTWNNYSNQYWPAHYLFDAEGRLRYVHFGEGKYDETERNIQALLAEAGKSGLTLGGQAPVSEGPDFTRIGTHETYLGYERMEYQGSPETVKHNAPQAYSADANPVLNKFYYTGTWNVGHESASPVNAGAGITYRYQANKINLVMGSTDGKPVKVKITVDGKLQPELTITDNKLYTLYDDNGTYGEHVMQIEFEGTNVSVYAFTFG